MGVDLTLSGVEPDRSMRLCTNQGFGLVGDWAGSLPPGSYPAVEAFFRDGSYAPTDELATQLNDAANGHGPADQVTAETLALILDRIGPGRTGETAAVEA